MTPTMTKVLNSEQRRFLDAQTQRAREAAQRAAEDALRALAVAEPSRPGYLSDDQNKLRLALRDKARQLGDDTVRAGAPLTNLVHDVAYEQWHRLLFARFLELNGLLRHPDYRDIPLSLEDCGDLASDLGEPDAWAVAARFASEILPGVFRLTDPAVQMRFAAEHRNALEYLLLDIPSEVFTTEDALGWVYQFWQTAEKKRVNDSGVKIGGADLSSVTQLFTENYMVRFLLENSLGAWWVTHHPESALFEDWEYLRHTEDGTPATGSFNEWPDRAADVSVMDPCCGSGHFLVAMFGMLWRMRAEEEGLTPAEAQDVVLRDNLHGLELDPRCTQIATFNVALEAWKQGGFRDLPAPQIACSGVPVRSPRHDWESLAGDDADLGHAMARLHSLFRDADTLGSLIIPRPTNSDDRLFGADLLLGAAPGDLRALLADALRAERQDDTVLGHAADEVAHAVGLLSRQYTLVATNPPYLTRGSMGTQLQKYVDTHHPNARADLAAAFVERGFDFLAPGGSLAVVSPQAWQLLTSYADLRSELLRKRRIDAVTRLGSGAFRQISGEVVNVTLSLISAAEPTPNHAFVGFMVHQTAGADAKATALRTEGALEVVQASQLKNPDSRITLTRIEPGTLLARCADGLQGIKTGDDQRFRRYFWEVDDAEQATWSHFLSSVPATVPYGGRSYVVRWEKGLGAMAQSRSARIVGRSAWGKRGVLVSQMSQALPVTIYTGELFDTNASPIVPHDPQDLGAIWAYCTSSEFAEEVRDIDDSLKVTNSTLVKVPFDRNRWQRIANEQYPNGIPEPHSDDPTQWLFKGDIAASTAPLQVAVARLLAFRWPDQQADALDTHADADGIVALQALPGEADATTRLRALLSEAYDGRWSSALERRLVIAAGGRNGKLDDWLRDSFFAQHVKVFTNRPFLWHIWDGRKDGFSAIANYHRLDRQTLEKLTFTSLGAWIDRQKHEVRAERAGADGRLASAEELQRKLKLILEGAPPYDIYVRWKSMAEQPIGWAPDLDDGVRLNIRPFITAGVLRAKVNVHWKKYRGKNPDGSERHNDLHPTLEERRAARREAGDAK